jgi:hypothetical protein
MSDDATFRPEIASVDFRNLRLVTATELQTIEPGLYLVATPIGGPQTRMAAEPRYDIERDTITEAQDNRVLVLLARVRHGEGRPIPRGVYRAYLREDGLQVIQQWAMMGV